MKRTERRGLTLLETVVVVVIGSLLSAIGLRIFQSMTAQGTKQDKATTGWHTYSRVSDQLRADLRGAIAVATPEPATLRLTVLTMGTGWSQERTEVEWRQRGKDTLVRKAGGQERMYDFGSALDSGRELAVRFRIAD